MDVFLEYENKMKEGNVYMNTLLKPHEVKKILKITKIEQYFETTKETKTALFYDLELTHTTSGLKTSSSGYSEIDVMVDCLKKLTEMLETKEFFDSIPFDNISTEVIEHKTTVK